MSARAPSSNPARGALVGVPATDWLAVEPIVDFATVLNLITFQFPAVVARAASDAQRPLSRGAFWWHDDKLEAPPVVPSADGGQQWVVPPDLSTRLTNRMKSEELST